MLAADGRICQVARPVFPEALKDPTSNRIAKRKVAPQIVRTNNGADLRQ